MDIKDIIVDSIKYPLSDPKKFFIFAIILLFTSIGGYAPLFNATQDQIRILVIIGFLVGFLVNGYFFRVLKYALDDLVGLPDFNNWKVMFTDGVKVFLVEIIYLLPAILLTIFAIFSSAEYLALTGTDVDALLLALTQSKILEMILYLIGTFTLVPFFLYGILYLLIITPLFLVAVGIMANYDGEFRAAFDIREIFEDMAGIGWGKLILWYVINGVIFFILFIVFINVLYYILSLILLEGMLLDTVLGIFVFLINPYAYLFLARSLALIYISE